MGGSLFCKPFFQFQPLLRRGRELALRQPVHAVVLDDVGHVDAAPDRMRELPEADRGAVAVAGDAEIDQLAVGDPAARWVSA